MRLTRAYGSEDNKSRVTNIDTLGRYLTMPPAVPTRSVRLLSRGIK